MLQLERLRSESQKLKDKAMEEEEKRTKAISLLKTVRQKLVKAEKERDDVSKELSTVRERGTLEVEKEKAERVKLEREIISVRAEKEKEVAGIKAHFDRESTLVKDRLEKEYAVRVGQVELEALSAKVREWRVVHRYTLLTFYSRRPTRRRLPPFGVKYRLWKDLFER